MSSSDPAINDGATRAAARPFDEVFEALWQPMVRLAASIVDEREVAEDVAQDAFAQALLRWSTIEDPVLYLRRAIVNRSRSELRKRIVRRRPLPPPQPMTAGEPRVEDGLVHAIRSLPARRRAVVALRFFEDLSEAEIARVLDVRVGTVKSTLNAALAQLRKEVTR